MKMILGLLLILPLAAIAAEHAGKPAPKTEAAQKAAEHGGKAMEMKEDAAEEGAAAVEEGAAAAEAGAAAAEEGAQQMQKKTSEHAGSPAK